MDGSVRLMNNAFITSKGSLYNLYLDGSTQRWKKANNEGVQPRSSVTVYISNEEASWLAVAVQMGPWWITKDNDIIAVTYNDEKRKTIQSIRHPKVGLSPLEIWFDEFQDISEIHVGNEIIGMKWDEDYEQKTRIW